MNVQQSVISITYECIRERENNIHPHKPVQHATTIPLMLKTHKARNAVQMIAKEKANNRKEAYCKSGKKYTKPTRDAENLVEKSQIYFDIYTWEAVLPPSGGNRKRIVAH